MFHNKAFTLIELLIAISIFILILASALGFLISSLRVQRKVLSSQELLGQVSFALDYMSRKITMARKEFNCAKIVDKSTCSKNNLTSYCLEAGYGCNYELTRNNKGIKFINYKGVCQEFFWENGRLKKGECYLAEGSCRSDGAWEFSFLTSDKINISDFNIELVGKCQCKDDGIQCLGSGDEFIKDNLQPRVTLLLKAQKPGQRPESRSEIVMQTTLSQRGRDLETDLK